MIVWHKKHLYDGFFDKSAGFEKFHKQSLRAIRGDNFRNMNEKYMAGKFFLFAHIFKPLMRFFKSYRFLVYFTMNESYKFCRKHGLK